MASVRKDILIDVRPDDVWAAIRDYGAVHRLVPGFLTDCQTEGDGSERQREVEDRDRRMMPGSPPMLDPTPARRRDTCTGAKRPRAGIAGPLVWSPIFHDWPKLDGVGDRNEPAAQCGSFARLTAGAEEGQQNPHSQPRRPTSTNSTGTPGAQGA